MGVLNFRILLDNPTGTYYAGSAVTGKVLLSLSKPKKVKGLRIKLKGFAHVSWKKKVTTRDSNGESRHEEKLYSAHEEYFSDKFYLAGNAVGEMMIAAGDYVYPFKAALPENLPTSFEGKEGHVRYEVKVTMHIPWSLDLHASELFQVITPLDLNTIPSAKTPVKRETSKNFCCFFCRSGPLTLVVCMPQAGVVPGDRIPVCIEVDNASNVEVDAIKLEIVQVAKYTARKPKHDTIVDYKVLNSKIFEGVAVSDSKTLSDTIKFPHKSYVNLKGCTIINVHFILKVTACAEGACRRNLSQDIPLIVGTIPVHQSQDGSDVSSFGMAAGQTNTVFESQEGGYLIGPQNPSYLQQTPCFDNFSYMPNPSAPPVIGFTGTTPYPPPLQNIPSEMYPPPAYPGLKVGFPSVDCHPPYGTFS